MTLTSTNDDDDPVPNTPTAKRSGKSPHATAERLVARVDHLLAADDTKKAMAAAWSLATDLGTQLPTNEISVFRRFQTAAATAVRKFGDDVTPVQALQRGALWTALRACEAYDAAIAPAVERKADQWVERLKTRREVVLARMAYGGRAEWNPKELAIDLNLQKTAVSRALRELKEDGFVTAVERSATTGDRRFRRYRVTTAGSKHAHTPAALEADPDRVRPIINDLLDHIPVLGRTGLLVRKLQGWGKRIAGGLRLVRSGFHHHAFHPVVKEVHGSDDLARVCDELPIAVAHANRGGGIPVVVLDDQRDSVLEQFSHYETGPDAYLKLRDEHQDEGFDLNDVLVQTLIHKCGVPVIHLVDAEYYPSRPLHDASGWKRLVLERNRVVADSGREPPEQAITLPRLYRDFERAAS